MPALFCGAVALATHRQQHRVADVKNRDSRRVHNPFHRMIPLAPMPAARTLLTCVLLFMAVRGPTVAREIHATPETYRALISRLQPGDRLILAPGVYRHGLRLHGLDGTPEQPIAILGPGVGPPARFLARNGANTVSLRDASYLLIESLELDGLGRNADAVKAESESRYTHHIVLSRLRISGHDADQAIVGISIQSPAWDWTIRECMIVGAGTGMYLGRSNGTAGLVGGVIERNVVRDTMGYNLQIKHQGRRPDVPGMPAARRMIVVRHNVFSKQHGASTGPAARPNVLLGHFPASGVGVDDLHVVYGNVFYQNAEEPLLQAEGNLAIYNNVFVNRHGSAISIQPHNARPRQVAVFNNTVLARDAGIAVRGAAPGHRPIVVGNLLFAGRPLVGGRYSGNLIHPLEKAERLLRAPYAEPPELDVSPQAGLTHERLNLPAELADLPDAGLDLSGEDRWGFMGGAYTSSDRPKPIALDRPPSRRY